jgi:hypothetical protein
VQQRGRKRFLCFRFVAPNRAEKESARARPRELGMSNSFEDIQRFRDTQVTSVVLTYQSVAKSLQLIAAETNAYSNNAVETWASFLERLLGAKSLDLVIQLQTEYTREAFADFVTQTRKMRELYSSLAKEMFRSVETAIPAFFEGAREES